MHSPRFKKVYGCDIETSKFDIGKSSSFIFGALFGEAEKRIFYEVDMFWSFVKTLRENTIIAFFNLPFDFHFLLSQIPAYKNVKICYLNKPSFVEIRKEVRVGKKKKKITITFLDIANFVGYMGGLRNVAKVFCPHLPKLEVDIENISIEQNRKEFEDYCLRDAQICYEVMNIILKRFGFGISLPQIAGRWIKKICGIVPERPEEVKRCERESYFGGYVEIFKFKEIFEGIKLDVNSMFPYVMTKPLPFMFIKELNEKELKNFNLNYNDRYAYLCYVKVYSDSDWNILPVRLNSNVVCPTGSFYGWYWEHLLLFAKKYGLIKRMDILRVLVYQKTNSHVNFIREKYRERLLAETEAEKTLIKLFLNAGYGKMAQLKRESVSFVREEFLEEFGFLPDYEEDEGMEAEYDDKIWTVRDYGNIIQLERKTDEESEYCFTAISSYITSLARLEIVKKIVKGREHVMAVDTDCITIKKEGFFKWEKEIGKNLGEFKIEGEGVIKLFAPKIYSVMTKDGRIMSKMKGVPNTKRSQTEIVVEEEERLVFRYRHLLKPRQAVRMGKMPYSEIFQEKEIFSYSHYAKGYVDVDGRVFPLRVFQNSDIKVVVPNGYLNSEFLKKFYKKMLKEEEI